MQKWLKTIANQLLLASESHGYLNGFENNKFEIEKYNNITTEK